MSVPSHGGVGEGGYRSPPRIEEIRTERLVVRGYLSFTWGPLITTLLARAACMVLVIAVYPPAGGVAMTACLLASFMALKDAKKTTIVSTKGAVTVDDSAPFELRRVRDIYLCESGPSYQIEAEPHHGKRVVLVAGIRRIEQASYLARLIAKELDKARVGEITDR